MESLPVRATTLTRLRTGSNSHGSPATKKQQRKTTSLPASTVEYLKAWMMSPEHIAHPYPTEHEKAKIMEDTGIEIKQLTNWFVNNRKRYWKPRVEARVQQEGDPSVAPATKRAASPPSKLVIPKSTSSLSSLSLSNVVSSTNFKTLLEKTALEEKQQLKANADPHCISESGSVASSEDNLYESSSDDSGEPLHFHTETVDLYITRPFFGKEPSLEHVVVSAPKKQDEVLHKFQNCVLSFHLPPADASNRRKFTKVRDEQLKMLMLKYLDQYLSATRAATPKKRKLEELTVTPRPQFRRVSVDLWKEACHAALNGYDNSSLPSLEEASRLFGYSSSSSE